MPDPIPYSAARNTQPVTRYLSIYLFLFTLSALEGMAALILLFREPSEAGAAGLFGYSRSRLAVGGAVLLPLLLFTALALIAWLRPGWIDRWHARLEAALPHPFLRFLLDWAPGLALALAGLLVAAGLPFINDYHWYKSNARNALAYYETALAAWQRFLPLTAWGLALLVQAILGLFALFPHLVSSPPAAASGDETTAPVVPASLRFLARSLVVALLLFAALLHWFILALRLHVLADIPGWYWEIRLKPFGARDVLFPLLLLLTLAVAAWVLRRTASRWRVPLLLIALGAVWIYAFGWIDSGSFEAVRLKWASTYHNIYAVVAAQEDISPVEIIRDYENRYRELMFHSTKPPGVAVLYTLLERLTRPFAGAPTSEARFLALSRLIAVLFPLLAFLPVLLLPRLQDSISGMKGRAWPAHSSRKLNPFTASLLYLTLPNVLLISLFLDTSIYPFLFLGGALLMELCLRALDSSQVRRAGLLALLIGLYLYLIAFLSFSLLPLGLLLLSRMALHLLLSGPVVAMRERFSALFRLGLAVLAGMALLAALFWAGFGYNPVQRYRAMLNQHITDDFYKRIGETATAAEVGVGLTPAQVAQAAVLNNIEFATAIGFPVTILALAGAGVSLARLLRGRSGPSDLLPLSFALYWLVLNLLGQTQGEVARLWSFHAPLVVLLASLAIRDLFESRRAAILVVIALQLITVFLTFHFQDLAV